MMHEHIRPELARVAPLIERYSAARADVSAWAPWREIVDASTAQLQCLRRHARLLARMTWRENHVRGEELLRVTELLLREHGAWTGAASQNKEYELTCTRTWLDDALAGEASQA